MATGKKSSVKPTKDSAKKKKAANTAKKISPKPKKSVVAKPKSVTKPKTKTVAKPKTVAIPKTVTKPKKSVGDAKKISPKPKEKIVKQKPETAAKPKPVAKPKSRIPKKYGSMDLDIKLVRMKKTADVRAELVSKLMDSAKKAIETEINLDSAPKQVCIICTDESIASGFLLADYANEVSEIPVTVTDDRRIPGWLNEESLAIIVSTNETKGAFSQSLKKIIEYRTRIVTITDFDYSYVNNALTKILSAQKTDAYDYIGHTAGMLAAVLAKAKVISKAKVSKIFDDVKINDDVASELILQLRSNFDKIMVINYLPNLRSTARLMKTIIPLYARRIVFCTEYPEFNHNEIVGWCFSKTRSQKFVNLFLCDKNTTHLLDVITKSELEILRENGVITKELTIGGKNNLEKNLALFVSCERVVGGI